MRKPEESSNELVVVRVVDARQPGGEALDRVLVVRVHVDVGAQLVGEPGQGDVLVTPALLELLDPAVGEVHLFTDQANAWSIKDWFSATCRECWPTDGEDDAGREITATSWSSLSNRFSRKCGAGPMLAGSSWTQRTLRRFGNRDSSARSSSRGSG